MSATDGCRRHSGALSAPAQAAASKAIGLPMGLSIVPLTGLLASAAASLAPVIAAPSPVATARLSHPSVTTPAIAASATEPAATATKSVAPPATPKVLAAATKLIAAATKLAPVLTKLTAETAKMGRARCPHRAAIVRESLSACWSQTHPASKIERRVPPVPQTSKPRLSGVVLIRSRAGSTDLPSPRSLPVAFPLSSAERRRGPGRGGALATNRPSPQPSPRSCVAGRGSKPVVPSVPVSVHQWFLFHPSQPSTPQLSTPLTHHV